MIANSHLLDVHNLKMHFPVTRGLLRKTVGYVKAVDELSLYIDKGEVFGLVGESGCGKSTLGRCILQINRPTSGEVIYGGENLTKLNKSQMRPYRRNIQMIVQDPYSSLDPRQSVGSIVGEGLSIHKLAQGKALRERVEELLVMVGLDPGHAGRYPHEFSGGQRQRIGIARALAVSPEFIVCDEPVSALDVSIQAQIINLLEKLREELNLTYLFIGHDLSVVRSFSDRVAVMYLGKIVEITNSAELYSNPLHPYTQALLSAVPIPDPEVDKKRERILLTGDVPSPMNPPDGCRFYSRCKYAEDICRASSPSPILAGENHWVSCHRVTAQRDEVSV